MKSIEKRSTFQNLLGPYNKTKPYSDCDIEKCQVGKRTFHALETTEPRLLLQTIFQPYLRLVQLLGSNPLKIQNGSASFKYLSWNVVYCLVIFGIFIFDTAYFLPVMKRKSEKHNDVVLYFIEMLLVFSQIIATLMSYIFIATQSNRSAEFWNRLQAVLIKLISRCPNHLDLIPSYRGARMKIIIWLMFTIVFGSCYIWSFQNGIMDYLTDQKYNSALRWFMFSGFAFYSAMLSLHILPSTCFTTFNCVLISCFNKLGCIALMQDGQCKVVVMKSEQTTPVLFQEIVEIYEELINLTKLLGCTYGIYLSLEILALIICTTINIFFMISKPDDFSMVFFNLAIVMPYLIWFHELCWCCSVLYNSTNTCHRSIRKAIATATKKGFMESGLIQLETPCCISASEYFTIDMRLFTTVVGTIATYLVVMLQFQFRDTSEIQKDHDLSRNVSSI